jgi:hypothetical protein
MQIATLEMQLCELSVGATVLADKERKELVAVSAPHKAAEEHVALLGTRLARPGGAAVLAREARARGGGA